MSSPTQLSLALLRRDGYTADVFERWITFGPPGPVERKGPSGIRRDGFGFIDVLAFRVGLPGCLAVQCCPMSTRSAHIAKMTEPSLAETIIEYLQCQNRVELHAWRKLLIKRGGKRRTWVCNRARFYVNQDSGGLEYEGAKDW